MIEAVRMSSIIGLPPHGSQCQIIEPCLTQLCFLAERCCIPSRGNRAVRPGSCSSVAMGDDQELCTCWEPVRNGEEFYVLRCCHKMHKECLEKMCAARGMEADRVRCPFCSTESAPTLGCWPEQEEHSFITPTLRTSPPAEPPRSSGQSLRGDALAFPEAQVEHAKAISPEDIFSEGEEQNWFGPSLPGSHSPQLPPQPTASIASAPPPQGLSQVDSQDASARSAVSGDPLTTQQLPMDDAFGFRVRDCRGAHRQEHVDPAQACIEKVKDARTIVDFKLALFPQDLFAGYMTEKEIYDTIQKKLTLLHDDKRTHRMLATRPDFVASYTSPKPFLEAAGVICMKEGIHRESFLLCMDSNLTWLENYRTRLGCEAAPEGFSVIPPDDCLPTDVQLADILSDESAPQPKPQTRRGVCAPGAPQAPPASSAASVLAAQPLGRISQRGATPTTKRRKLAAASAIEQREREQRSAQELLTCVDGGADLPEQVRNAIQRCDLSKNTMGDILATVERTWGRPLEKHEVKKVEATIRDSLLVVRYLRYMPRSPPTHPPTHHPLP